MALLRFLVQLTVFIGALACAAAMVLVLILMVRYPPILVVVGIACLLFYGVLKRLPKIG